MAKCWGIRDYVDRRGTNVIRAWLHGVGDLHGERARAKLDWLLRLLEVTPVLQGRHFKRLKGPYRDLMELRVEYNKIQYRPLACYGPGRADVTLLIGVYERNHRFDPSSAPDTALFRMREVLVERGRSCEHEFD